MNDKKFEQYAVIASQLSQVFYANAQAVDQSPQVEDMLIFLGLLNTEILCRLSVLSAQDVEELTTVFLAGQQHPGVKEDRRQGVESLKAQRNKRNKPLIHLPKGIS